MKPFYRKFWNFEQMNGSSTKENISIFDDLKKLNWLEFTAARKEIFMSEDGGIKYTYGIGEFARTYESIKFSNEVEYIKNQLNKEFDCNYNVCFLNRYEDEKNSLDYHADDSPEMNPDHPICVVSFGTAREIYWKEKGFKGKVPDDQKQKLDNGSLFIMPAGFQQKYQHKIPKCDHKCGMRISLTYRNYKNVVE